MKVLLERRNRLRVIYVLIWLFMIVVGFFKIPPILSYMQSQDDLKASVQDFLDRPIAEISVTPAVPGRIAAPCYVTRSKDEITEIVNAMRGVGSQLQQGTARDEPFELTLTFHDGSRANFMLYRRKDNLARAHLEKLEYAATPDGEYRLIGDAGLVFPGIGTWAIEAVNQNNCRK